MVGAGDRAAVIETTSHGLALDRVGGDRLRRRDPHQPDPRAPRAPRHVGGLPRRQAARSSSGSPRRGGRRPSRASRAAGRDRHRQRRRSVGRRFIGVDPGGGRPGPDLRHGPGGRRPRDRGSRRTRGGLRVAYDAPSGAATLDLQLAGRFNVHNALAVVALGEAVGLDPAAVRDGLAAVAARPGPDGADRRSASRSGSSSTTPTARRRSRPCSTCSPRSPRPRAAA